MAKFETYPDAVGEWRWRLKASNGRIVAQGESYGSQRDARRGVTAVLRALSAKLYQPFKVFEDDAGQWRWHLLSSNGRIVACGEGYTTRSGAVSGTKAVRRAADQAQYFTG